MARRMFTKRAKRGDVSHHLYGSLPYYLDDERDVFYCRLPNGATYENESARVVRQTLLDAMHAACEVTWSRLILVRRIGGPDRGGLPHAWDHEHPSEVVGIHFARYLICHTQAGDFSVPWVQVGAEDQIPLSRDQTNFRGWSKPRPEASYEVLPYSEEVWSGLQAVQASITAASRKLDQLLGAEDLGDRLTAAAQLVESPLRLLPEQITAMAALQAPEESSDG